MTTPPVEPGPLHRPGKPADGLETYNRVAETVGMMPSFRKFDYIFQGSCVVVGALVGAGIGFAYAQGLGAIMGGLAGFIVMGILSGLVLMVLGWVRAMKK
jgi:hypothetical protein